MTTDCEKCGKVEFGGIRKLAGGRTVNLCNKCCNLWHEYIIDSGLWEQLTLAMREGERLVMGGKATALEIESISKTVLNIESKLYEESRQWLAEPLPKAIKGD